MEKTGTGKDPAARTGVEAPRAAFVHSTNAPCIMPKNAGNRFQIVRNCPEKIRVGNVSIKIYRGKTRGYETFIVTYYLAGRRKRESFAKLPDAKERAREVARAVLNDRLAVLELTSADRDGYIRAISLLRPFGMPLHAAIEEYVASRNLLNGDSVLAAIQVHCDQHRKVIDKQVREIVGELIESKQQAGLSRRYVQTLQCHLNRFADAFQTSISNVISRLIEEWLASLKLGARARNNVRQGIVTLFHFARSRHYLPKGQPTEADDVPKLKERTGKIGILTPEQLALLMEKAPADFQLYFALGAFSGMRPEEILRLEWLDVNFARRHVTVAAEKAKTATRRLVPIQPNLMEWLLPHRHRTGSLFRSRRFIARAIKFAKNLGIEWPNNALRHSYATYRLAAIADTARVALEMGNSPAKLMTNYRELADEQEAAAWFSIQPRRPANIRDFDTHASA